MGSSSSYGSADRFESYSHGLLSEDSSEREAVKSARSAEVKHARERVLRGDHAPTAAPRSASALEALRDDRAVATRITRPDHAAQRAYVVLVDNSGSNRSIAEHLKGASGYLTGMLKAVDGGARVAFVYFSDHSDGDLCMQEADFVAPTPEGDKQLYNTMLKTLGAGGDDIPEAIECAVMRATEVDFAHVPRDRRTLILVTDSVPHGMEGFAATGERDNGCPRQVSWRAAMAAAREVYGEFVLVGSGKDPAMRGFQRRLFETSPGVEDAEAVGRNFIDLSGIPEARHRNGIVGNALLFVMARACGKQTVEAFLGNLYAKWLENPIFGDDTDRRARERIRSFGLYLRHMYEPTALASMLREVLAED